MLRRQSGIVVKKQKTYLASTKKTHGFKNTMYFFPFRLVNSNLRSLSCVFCETSDWMKWVRKIILMKGQDLVNGPGQEH